VTKAEIIALRHRLGLERAAFARITGTDVRTVTRWETGACEPSGTSLSVLTGIREALDQHPERAEAMVRYIARAAAMGGLSYLLVKLLSAVVPSEP